MSAKLECWWKGSTDAATPDMVLSWDVDPPGAEVGPLNIWVVTECDTAAQLQAAVRVALNTAVAGAPFSVMLDTSTGRYTVTSVGGTFALAFNDPLKSFMAMSAQYGTHAGGPFVGVSSAAGADYPPSQFRPVAPIPEPDPYWRLFRRFGHSDGGRVESSIQAYHAMQPLTLRFGPNTGRDWTAIAAWLEYVLAGVRFSLFRNTADATLYTLVQAAKNPDGRSLCILANDSMNAARRFLGRPATTHGAVTLEARILEGY